MSSSRLPFLFTDFEHIKYGMAFHALCRCHTVRSKCDQLFFTGCTISLHLPSTCFARAKFYSLKHFVIFSFANASNLIYISFPFYSSKWDFFFAGISIYIHQKCETFSFRLNFFLSFHITNAGKCNQTVKYSNKRGIINTRRCVCVHYVYSHDQSECVSCVAFSAIIVL